MGARTDTRRRMVASAAVLMTEHGIAGTSVARVLEHSQGPRGSVGFHFPGGRAQLVQEALVLAGERITGQLRAALTDGASTAEVIDQLHQHYRGRLVESDFASGCPVWAAAQEAHDDPDLGPVVARVVGEWVELLAALLQADGHPTAEARRLAPVVVSSLEGAVTLCRVVRDVAPLDASVEVLRQALRSATV